MSEQQPIIRIKKLHPDACLPRYMTDLSAGMDVHALPEQTVTLSPGQRCLVPTGFALAIPSGYEIQVRPRSGLAIKHGVTLLNTPGTIDADYRGELGIILINHGGDDFIVARGDRIAQLVVASVSRAEIEEVTELDETSRGAGGFGHTGIGTETA